MSYPFNIARSRVSLTGSGGAALSTGDVVTGETAIRDIVFQHATAKITFEATEGTTDQAAAHHLWIDARDGNGFAPCFDPAYGDWTFCVGPFDVAPDSATVIESNSDVAEVAFEWTNFDMRSDLYPSGIPFIDYVGVANFPESTALPNYKRITHTRFVKTLRFEAGRNGYFVGYHTDPYVCPQPKLLRSSAAANRDSDYGEREMGTGGGTAVAWSSAGSTWVSRHPGWGQKSEWTAAVSAVGAISNRIAWMGLDDPRTGIWADAAVIATQIPGFPNTQSTGPFYVADIHATRAFARYIVVQKCLQIGIWQFATDQRGYQVVHYVNEHHDARGMPYRFQMFIGAEPHTADSSSAFANEPTATIRATIAARATDVNGSWPR